MREKWCGVRGWYLKYHHVPVGPWAAARGCLDYDFKVQNFYHSRFRSLIAFTTTRTVKVAIETTVGYVTDRLPSHAGVSHESHAAQLKQRRNTDSYAIDFN